jgi:hypothetical protein
MASMACSVAEIFPPTYGHGGFERKFRRCQSRLHELLAQPVETEEKGDAGRSRG